jgi:uncharacterized protein YjiS (DUF1127 family)
MITHQARQRSFGYRHGAAPRQSPGAVIAAAAGSITTAIIVWLERARERRQLLALSDRALKDFGMSFADAAKEGDKPFWRA